MYFPTFYLFIYLLDFERAGINAIQTQFPTAQVYGCFYHLSSNIWKHIQSSGLQAHYVNDDEFSIHLRMIAALAFVPPFDVEDAFEELALEIVQAPELISAPLNGEMPVGIFRFIHIWRVTFKMVFSPDVLR